MQTHDKKQHACRNCSLVGHVYRVCPEPITSFGVICYKFRKSPVSNKKEPEYLMIQRKDSLCFMEFIRGKFDPTDGEYIKKLLSGMTRDERDMILTQPFKDLWNYIWLQPSIPRLTVEFENASAKFAALEERALREYIETTDSPYLESEFGFPKGRRKLRENDMVCAVREFHEETGFSENDIYVHSDILPFEEVFYGTNNIRYRHVYYLARMIKQDCDDPQIDPGNINQMREVRAVRWFNYEDTVAHIRDYNTERKALFATVHELVLEMG